MNSYSNSMGRDMRELGRVNAYLGFFFFAIAVGMALAVFIPGYSLQNMVGQVPYMLIFFVIGVLALGLLVNDVLSSLRQRSSGQGHELAGGPDEGIRKDGTSAAGETASVPEQEHDAGADGADSERLRELQREVIKLETRLELAEEQAIEDFAGSLGELLQDGYRILRKTPDQYERLLESLDYRFEDLELEVLHGAHGEPISEYPEEFEVVEAQEDSELPEFHIESVELPAVVLNDELLCEGQVVLSANREEARNTGDNR